MNQPRPKFSQVYYIGFQLPGPLKLSTPLPPVLHPPAMDIVQHQTTTYGTRQKTPTKKKPPSEGKIVMEEK